MMIRDQRTPAEGQSLSPICPACGAAMALLRVIPRDGYHREQLIFECRPCSVVFTQAPP